MRFLATFSFWALLLGCTTSPGGGVDGGPPPTNDDAGTPSTDAAAASDASDPPPVDAGGPADAGPLSVCPPQAPFGSDPGEVAEDLVLMDCDGVAHSLHELCDRDAVWLFEMADWCPPCRDFASADANRIYDRFEPASFGAWMVVSEDAGFAAADAEDCAAIRDRYGIHMPVLYDPTGAFQAAFGVPSNEVHVVLRRGAVIDWVGHYAGDEVESRIEAVLAP